MMKNYSIQSILDWLETKNYLKERRKAEAFVLTHSSIYKLPIYIHLLMGFGALIGCICVISLLISADLISLKDVKSLFIYGLASMLISLGCYYSLRYKTPLLQSFGLQCAFILMIVGKILVVIGFDQLPDKNLPYNLDDWFLTFGLLAVTLPTYFLFPNQIDRFLSCLALLGSILYNTIFLYSSNLYFFAYFCILIALLGFFFVWRKKSLSWSPLGYAIVITLCSSALYLLVSYEKPFSGQESMLSIPPLFFNGILGLALIFLCYLLGKERHSIIQPSTIAACVGICLLSFVSTPGILISLGLLILGYAKHEMALNIIGACFLCIFLVSYYYSLPFTLDYKSALLISTGVVLLGARFVVKMMQWDNDHL